MSAVLPDTRAEALASDVVAVVQPPGAADVAGLKAGTILVGFLSPFDQPGLAAAR